MLAENVIICSLHCAKIRPTSKLKIIEILNPKFELELIQHETIVFAKYGAVYGIRGFTCS